MRSKLAALTADARLSDTARVIAFWLLLQPSEDGYVEMPYSVIRPFLHGFPSDDSIRRHMRMLEASEWVERRPGGKGHGDSFKVCGKLIGSAPVPTLNIDYAPEPTLKPDRLGIHADPNADVVVAGVTTQQEKQQHAREESFPLSEKAGQVFQEQGEGFAGFRGALRDYLTTRVPTARQYGYMQTIAAWKRGTDASVFRLPDGTRAPAEDIPGLLATALNELLATDEKMMARPLGDPGNLKTKLAVLCRQRSDHTRPPRDPGPANGNGKPPLTEAQRALWYRLREEAEKRGMDPEQAAETTYEEARRSA